MSEKIDMITPDEKDCVKCCTHFHWQGGVAAPTAVNRDLKAQRELYRYTVASLGTSRPSHLLKELSVAGDDAKKSQDARKPGPQK